MRRRTPLVNLNGNQKHFLMLPGNFTPCEDPLGKENSADVKS